MWIPVVTLVTLLAVFLCPFPSPAQQAGAPIYKDGDWWRIKVEVARPTGVSVSGSQLGGFPEYLVKFESGHPKVIGIRGNDTKDIDGPGIVPLVLGRPGWRGELVRFPLRVGAEWTDRFQYQPRGMQVQSVEGQYEVKSWEKVKTATGDFDAFKIVLNSFIGGGPKGKGRSIPLTSIYYYAPAIKAIVALNEVVPEAGVTSTLVEFKHGD